MTDQLDLVGSKIKTAPAPIDRAVIGKAEALKLQAWIEQIRGATRGFISLTKSDLVNFLIRDHKDELTTKEILQIRSLNYDPIKHINWISQELKAAFLRNDLEMVALLQSELKQVELSPQIARMDMVESGSSITKRRARKHVETSIDESTSPDVTHLTSTDYVEVK